MPLTFESPHREPGPSSLRSSSLSFSLVQSPHQCSLVKSIINTCICNVHLKPNLFKYELLIVSQACSSCNLPWLSKYQLYSPSHTGQNPWSHSWLFLSYSSSNHLKVCCLCLLTIFRMWRLCTTSTVITLIQITVLPCLDYGCNLLAALRASSLCHSRSILNIGQMKITSYHSNLQNFPMSPMSLKVKVKVLIITCKVLYNLFFPSPVSGLALSLLLSPLFTLLQLYWLCPASFNSPTQSHLRAFTLATPSVQNTPILDVLLPRLQAFKSQLKKSIRAFLATLLNM